MGRKKQVCKNCIKPVEVKGSVRKWKTRGVLFDSVIINYKNNADFLMKDYFNASAGIQGG